MSGHGQSDADAVHDAGHETSSDDFPADEPRSPGWLPLLGGALFLAGIFAFVVSGAGGKTAEELAKDTAASPSAAPTAAAPAPTQVAAPGSPPAPRPAPAMAPGAAPPANHPQFPRPAGN